jgi:hypothetical protein
MARNAISLSTYALVLGSETRCDTNGHVLTKVGNGKAAHDVRSKKPHPGPFKIKWREDVEQGGARERVQRSKTCSTLAAFQELHRKTLHALEAGEVAPEAKARSIPTVAALDQIALAWLVDKKSQRKIGTIDVYKSSLKRIFETIRTVRKIPDDVAVAATVLSVSLFSDLRTIWKAEDDLATAKKAGGRFASPWRRYDLSLVLYTGWKWAASQPLEYPGVPPAPQDPSLVLPTTPPRPRAPTPATWEEMDAIVGRAYDHDVIYGDLLLGERSLGLRVGQIEGIRRGAINVARSVLVVEIGKSEAEEAEQREVPIPAFLLDAWMHRIAACRSDDDYIFPASTRATKSKHFVHHGDVVKGFFDAACAAGEIREGIYKPRTHRKNRTTHGLRAGYMAGLEAMTIGYDGEDVRLVPDKVIDYLVGHHPQTTRDRSYVPPSQEQLERAAARVPVPSLSAGALDNVVRIGR